MSNLGVARKVKGDGGGGQRVSVATLQPDENSARDNTRVCGRNVTISCFDQFCREAIAREWRRT
jgi:hypothetical protein